MNKRVKALIYKRTLIESDMLATEWMLANIDSDTNVINVAQTYLDVLGTVKVKVVDEYNKALGEL
jgi:hypothetical protein